MSDRFPGQIVIGGQISRHSLARLIHAINADEPNGPDWHTPVQINDAQSLLDACEDGQLKLANPEALEGTFTEIESACVALDLIYVRQSNAYCEHDGETAWNDPATSDAREPWCYSRQNGTEVVDLDGLVEPVSEIKKIIDHMPIQSGMGVESLMDIHDRLRQQLEKLQHQIPVIPAVPKFEIVNKDKFGPAPYFSVEYDVNYCGGDYDGVGEIIYLSAARLKGSSPQQVFVDVTGMDDMHIVSYNVDELYGADGRVIDA